MLKYATISFVKRWGLFYFSVKKDYFVFLKIKQILKQVSDESESQINSNENQVINSLSIYINLKM